jgi:hypothetical protein
MAEHLAEKIPQRQKWAQEMMDSMTQNAKNSGLDILKSIIILSMHTTFYMAKNIISQMN